MCQNYPNKIMRKKFNYFWIYFLNVFLWNIPLAHEIFFSCAVIFSEIKQINEVYKFYATVDWVHFE